jgi:hypothetical protein
MYPRVRLGRLFEFGLIILLFTVNFAGQTVDPAFRPLLQDFGGTQNRPAIRVSAVQPDGKILVGGNFTVISGLARSGIARFSPDGTPDPTFDAGDIGVAETNDGRFDRGDQNSA